MNEDEVAAKLQENISRVDEAQPALPIVPAEPTSATDATLNYDLDEMTLYKLHDYFGERYKSPDEESSARVKFIYERVAQEIGTADYGFVVGRIRELERILGTATAQDRLYRMYQWLKLDKVRRSVDAEMGALQA